MNRLLANGAVRCRPSPPRLLPLGSPLLSRDPIYSLTTFPRAHAIAGASADIFIGTEHLRGATNDVLPPSDGARDSVLLPICGPAHHFSAPPSAGPIRS